MHFFAAQFFSNRSPREGKRGIYFHRLPISEKTNNSCKCGHKFGFSEDILSLYLEISKDNPRNFFSGLIFNIVGRKFPQLASIVSLLIIVEMTEVEIREMFELYHLIITNIRHKELTRLKKYVRDLMRECKVNKKN